MKISELRKIVKEEIKNICESYVPSNIAEFAKRNGVLPMVKTISKWVEKASGKSGISGGTAIGKNYSTLVLDIRYQDAAIYYDLDTGIIKLYGTPVNNYGEFKKAYDNKNSGK